MPSLERKERVKKPKPRRGVEVPQGTPEKRWADPTLQNLERWLTTHGVDQSVAQGASFDLWSFQAFKVVPIHGTWLPIGLSAKQAADGIQIKAYLPESTSKDEVSLKDEINKLKLGFGDATQDTRRAQINYDLEFISLKQSPGTFNQRVQNAAHEKGFECLGLVHYYLRGDLRRIMDPKEVDIWLKTPNLYFVGQTPEQVIMEGDPKMWIRTLILRRELPQGGGQGS